MRIGGVYLIINIHNHRIYIGSSNDIKRRWREHRCNLRRNTNKNEYLQKDWNDFSEDGFEFKIVEKIDSINTDSSELKAILYAREDHWITAYKDLGYYLYNIRPDADGSSIADETKTKLTGRHHTEEAKRKIGQASKGRTKSLQTRQKISDLKKGTHHSLETRIKMSQSRKKLFEKESDK